MKEIGVFDAKTKFSQLIEHVQNSGRKIRITKRGKVVAELSGVQAERERKRSHREIFEELEQLRKKLPKSTLEEIKSDIAEGRH